jgi:hypothetical protein
MMDNNVGRKRDGSGFGFTNELSKKTTIVKKKFVFP